MLLVFEATPTREYLLLVTLLKNDFDKNLLKCLSFLNDSTI
jgi:hypothetical protein